MQMIRDDGFKKMLKEKGFKVTGQRESILDVLQANSNLHLTAEEIYTLVKKKCPEIGLATVYRTIQLLLELKLIETLNLNDGFIRYEIDKWDETRHHHHHLICEKCGKLIEVEDDLLDQIEQTCNEKYHFHVTNHVVKFYGICEECMKKQEQESEN